MFALKALRGVGGFRRTRPPRVGLGRTLVARSGAARFAGFGFLALAWLHEVPEVVEHPPYFKRVGFAVHRLFAQLGRCKCRGDPRGSLINSWVEVTVKRAVSGRNRSGYLRSPGAGQSEHDHWDWMGGD